MDNLKMFSLALILFGVASACLFFYILACMKVSYIEKAEKIPRNFTLGMIFGFAAVCWCVPQAIAIFSAGMTPIIYWVAVIAFVVGILFLDYLFARAFAGFIILLSHYFLAESFAADLHLLWLFSSLCVIMGVFGIVIGGVPHLMRDLLRNICRRPVWKILMCIVAASYSILGLVTGIVLLI